MGIFNRFLSKDKYEDHSIIDEPHINFGRYTDRNKTREQYESWDKSINLFKDKKFIEAYYEFFNYLKDKKVDNVTYELDGSRINFTLVQGSKIVKGILNEREVQAEAEVARFEQQNVAAMRKLLQENYYLYFCKYAIKNDIYTLKYYSHTEDAHPSSLYYALKELATEADMYDDVLVADFESVKPINIEHIEQLSEEEIQIKLRYFRKWIKETFERIEQLDSHKFTGAIAFNLLNMAYKIYYLLAPEGTLLDDIRYIQSIFFNEDNRSAVEKIHEMKEEFQKQMDKSDDEIRNSLYKVKATFAVARPTIHKTIKGFMETELEKTNWYIENKYDDIVREICEYILSYSSFNYGLPSVANDMLMILWRVFYPEFFIELGFSQVFYSTENQKLHKENISKRIYHIVKKAKKKYTRIEFNPERLDFSNRNNFAISFFIEFKNLNYD